MLLTNQTNKLNTTLLRSISNSIVNGINLNGNQYKSLLFNSNISTTNIIYKRYHNQEAASDLTAPKQGFSTEKNTNNYNNENKKEKKEKKRRGFVSGG